MLSHWINVCMAFPSRFRLGSRHLKTDPSETYAFSLHAYSHLLSFQCITRYLHACWHTSAEAHRQTHMCVCMCACKGDYKINLTTILVWAQRTRGEMSAQIRFQMPLNRVFAVNPDYEWVTQQNIAPQKEIFSAILWLIELCLVSGSVRDGMRLV